jgi:hypothetical protein
MTRLLNRLDLLNSLDAPPSGRRRAIWLDTTRIGRARPPAGGTLPWDRPAEFAAGFTDRQAAFGSDAMLVDLTDLTRWRLAGDERLRASISGGHRPGRALRTLLADDGTRATAVAALGELAAAKADVPMLVTVPTPARWLAVAARQARSAATAVDLARAGTAAVYVAEFLGALAGIAVDGLVIDEGSAAVDRLAHPEVYRPVLTIAQRYRWPVVVRADAAVAWPFGIVTGVGAWIGSRPAQPATGPSGAVVTPDFWAGADAPAEAQFLYGDLPAEVDPDAIRRRIDAAI